MWRKWLKANKPLSWQFANGITPQGIWKLSFFAAGAYCSVVLQSVKFAWLKRNIHITISYVKCCCQEANHTCATQIGISHKITANTIHKEYLHTYVCMYFVINVFIKLRTYKHFKAFRWEGSVDVDRVQKITYELAHISTSFLTS